MPVRHDRWWYYSRTVEGEQYPVEGRVTLADAHRPTLDGDGAPLGEELLLDQNAEAQGHDFFAVAGSEVSPQGDLLAYAADLAGDERYDIRVRRIATSELLDDAVLQTGGSLAWSLDGRQLFYTGWMLPGGPTRSGATRWARRPRPTCSSTTSPTSAFSSG